MLRIRPLITAFLLLAPFTVYAEDAPPVTTLLGAGIWSRPAYDGADTSHTVAIPVVRHYGKPWFARTTFGMLEGGARMELLSGFTVGAQLAYEGGRNSTESAFLSSHQLATIDPGFSVGVHAELEKNIGPIPVIALLRYRQDSDSARGTQTDLRLTAGIYGGTRLNAGVFVQTTRADAKSAQYYYGLTAQQAAASGLPAYTAQGGTLFNAAGLLWSFELDARWVLLGSFEGRRVRADALNSPLTQVDSNRYASLGLAYQF